MFFVHFFECQLWRKSLSVMILPEYSGITWITTVQTGIFLDRAHASRLYIFFVNKPKHILSRAGNHVAPLEKCARNPV